VNEEAMAHWGLLGQKKGRKKERKKVNITTTET
jgi:hypothetical protein